ncbi:hypothetical protein cypCar_00005222 [Cyprinus carpio]|nr:hypothetical protein cypCar_00005222 [Cyprinus carpio]
MQCITLTLYNNFGPLYYLSVTGSQCFQEVAWHVVTYTVIPMFTVARAGYHARVYVKGQLRFEYTQPYVPCEDVKICYIIKGVFTVSRMGFRTLIYYKDQLWLDQVQPDVPCEDLKICDIIKGETLHDTVPIYVRKYYGPKARISALCGC